MVCFFAVQRRQFVQFMHFAIDAGAHEALGAQLMQHLTCSPLRSRTTGASSISLRLPSGQGQHLIHHLADGLRFQRSWP
jgi:hypothetical protein